MKNRKLLPVLGLLVVAGALVYLVADEDTLLAVLEFIR